MVILGDQSKMVEFYQVVGGPYIVHTTKHEAAQNVLGIYQVYLL